MTLAQQFEERGMKRGIQQGIEQDMQQCIQQGESALLTRLIQYRFGEIPLNYIAQANTQTLLLWREKVLDAKTLEGIFNDN